MEEGNTNPATSAAGAAAAAQQQQQILLQQQLFLMQQQRPRPHMQQPNPQQSHLQQAMARFPSNIDAHLRAPGFRSLQFAQAQLQQGQMSQAQAQLQQQMARSAASSAPAVRNPEIEMALQDASKVCNPDVKTPFASIEDAVNRLPFPLPNLLHLL